MQNSGIKQILSLVYAENSVDKMLAGKSYERAMRADDLLSLCLKIIIMEQVKQPATIEDGLKLFDSCIEQVFYSRIGAIDFESNNEVIDQIVSQLEQVKESLVMSDLNKFWLQYVDIVELLYNNLMAERCSMWDMYKYSLRKMLPYLAGTGRNNYTRSVCWLLQEIDNLNDEMCKEFRNGLFFVRRAGAFWSGVSPDLCDN